MLYVCVNFIFQLKNNKKLKFVEDCDIIRNIQGYPE